MSDPDRLGAIRQRRAAMPDGPLDVEEDRTEEEYYMRWAMVRYGPPDEYGERDWIAGTNAANVGVAEFIAHAAQDIDWLISEVERLRGRLRELEWSSSDRIDSEACPVCQYSQVVGHLEDCWLAAEIAKS